MVGRTSCVFILFLFFIFVLVNLSFNIEEAVHCWTFVPVLLWD